MRNFRELNVYIQSMKLCKEVYSISKLFPQEERFGICSQIQRAAVSIPSNIAEGASRRSEIEFSRFLEISLGSSYELETQLKIAIELNYIKNEDLISVLVILDYIQKGLNSFIGKINK